MEVIIVVLFMLTLYITNGVHPLNSANYKDVHSDFKSFPWNLAERYNSDEENFYEFFNNVTHGKIYNISNRNHEMFKVTYHIHCPYPNLPKLTQTYPNLPKLIQTYPNLPKLTQTYPNLPKLTFCQPTILLFYIFLTNYCQA